ncbi:UNVERIFIED_CONTAM: hypothetical protein RMT77_011295 [Armadillidium vulgare]
MVSNILDFFVVMLLTVIGIDYLLCCITILLISSSNIGYLIYRTANIDDCIIYIYSEKSFIRTSVKESRIARSTVITSWLYLLPIQEERLALKKHKLPNVSLRPFSRRRKFVAQGVARTKIGYEFAKFGLLMDNVLVLPEIIFITCKSLLFILQHKNIDFNTL